MDVNKSVRILLFPLSYERRWDAEYAENSEFTLKELEKVIPEGVECYRLTDFMDACNDEEIDLNKYWVSYIRIVNRKRKKKK